MRLSGAHIRNNLSLLAVNYVLCALFAALEAAPGLLPQGSGLGVAIGLGVMTGIFYLASFILFQWNVSINGVVFSATFMKLGVLVPTALSVFLFHELPSVLQVLGFIGALAAIVLIQSDGGEAKAANRPALILLLLGGGLCDATPKIYAQLGPPALERAFLFYAFLVAMVLCIALVLWKKQRLGRAELLLWAADQHPKLLFRPLSAPGSQSCAGRGGLSHLQRGYYCCSQHRRASVFPGAD